MTAVYILGSGSRWRNNELRYSLRSLKYARKVTDVVVVGGYPLFLNDSKVKHIYCEDELGNGKLLNAMKKINAACKSKDVSERFLLMNDDFFFLKYVDEIPDYSVGTLEDMKKKHTTRGGHYYNAIVKTKEWLQQQGVKEPVSFEAHYPMIMRKTVFSRMMTELPREQFLFRSVYGWMAGRAPTITKDWKAFTPREFFHNVRGADFVSTDNATVLDSSVKHWFLRKYPERSEYEDGQKRFETLYVVRYRGVSYPAGVVLSPDIEDEFIRKNKDKLIEVFVSPI